MRKVSDREFASVADPFARVARWSDLIGEGVTTAEIRSRLGGTWRRQHHGVVVLSDEVEVPLELQAHAALLSVSNGAVVSHLSAARLHGLAGADGLPGFWRPRNQNIHLTIPRETSLSPRSGISLHRHDLDPSELVEVGGLPVTSVERTLVDLLLSTSRDLAAVALEGAIHDGQLPESQLAELPKLVRGRHGTMRAKKVLKQIRVGSESPLETLSRLKFADLGLIASVIQPIIFDDRGRFLGRADLGFGGDPPVVLGEADGKEVHTGLEMRARDAHREEAIRLTGREVVRWTWGDLVNDAGSIVGRIRAFAAQRGLVL